MSPVLFFLAIAIVVRVSSHGTMVLPTPRQPESLYWYQVGCLIGCECSGGGKETYPTKESMNCLKPAEPTLTKAEFLTWNIEDNSPRGSWNQLMPWRAPGTSKPLDSCGIASGFLPTAKDQYPHKFKDSTIKQGAKGSELAQGKVTKWKPGSTVTASYHLTVNHGGGYQYRVCPIGSTVNEACFESNPLAFANDDSTVVYSSGKEIKIKATDVTVGVRPSGSTWRRLPMPGCNCDLGTSCTNETMLSTTKVVDDFTAYNEGTAYGHCKYGLQFQAPHLKDGAWADGYGYYVAELGDGGGISKKDSSKASGEPDGCAVHKDEAACEGDSCTWYSAKGKTTCYKKAAESDTKADTDKSKSETVDKGKSAGFDGSGTTDTAKVRQWVIVDELVAPSEKGEYILQWRWDNEQTPQIWTTCADILVADDDYSAGPRDMPSYMYITGILVMVFSLVL